MVTKNPNNPILVRDKAWETQRVDLYGSAVFDPATNKLQIFYSTMSLSAPVKHDDMLAYAVSDDMGATWTKPDLGLIPFKGDPHTNLVLKAAANDFSGIVHGPCVFLVLREKLGLIVQLKKHAEFHTGVLLRGHIRMEDQHASGRSLSGLGTGRI